MPFDPNQCAGKGNVSIVRLLRIALVFRCE